MAEASQSSLPSPEIIKTPETSGVSSEVKAPLESKPPVDSSNVDNTLAADIAASARSLEDTMSIQTPDQINVTGDSETGRTIEGWFTKSNENKK